MGNTEILAAAYALRFRAILNGAPGEIPAWAIPPRTTEKHAERLSHPAAEKFPAKARAYKRRMLDRWTYAEIAAEAGVSAPRACDWVSEYINHTSV